MGGARDVWWTRLVKGFLRDTRMASDGLAACDRAEVALALVCGCVRDICFLCVFVCVCARASSLSL